MKWENCDINVVKQANMPTFSKLDDIGTPLRFFELFFGDALVGMIVNWIHTPSGTVVERKQTLVLKTYNKTFHLFLGMLLLSGCHEF